VYTRLEPTSLPSLQFYILTDVFDEEKRSSLFCQGIWHHCKMLCTTGPVKTSRMCWQSGTTVVDVIKLFKAVIYKCLSTQAYLMFVSNAINT